MEVASGSNSPFTVVIEEAPSRLPDTVVEEVLDGPRDIVDELDWLLLSNLGGS